MKKIVSWILLLLVTLCAVGCGTYHKGGQNGGDGGSSGGNGGSGYTYTVRLQLNGQPFIPTESIDVQWTAIENGALTGFHKSAVDSTGKATISGLDGEYRVTLSDVPDGYAYNPNIYFANNEYNQTTIELVPLKKQNVKPGKEDGSEEYKAIILRETGVYCVELKSATHKVHYEYNVPATGGFYYIESWCDTVAGVLNPYADVYTGTHFSKYFDHVSDRGFPEETGYTTNFNFEAKAEEEQQGHATQSFSVYAIERNNNYPVKLYFHVYWFDEYDSGYEPAAYISATQATQQAPEETGSWRWAYDETPTVWSFDGSKYVFNPDDGYYHVGSVDGPYLYAMLANENPFMQPYEGAPVYFTNIASVAPSNPLQYIKELDRTTGKKTNTVWNYTQFVASYGLICNSTGACLVTEELKWFLQAFTVSNAYFYDGSGTVEFYARNEYNVDVSVLERDQWLFVCGYYE